MIFNSKNYIMEKKIELIRCHLCLCLTQERATECYETLIPMLFGLCRDCHDKKRKSPYDSMYKYKLREEIKRIKKIEDENMLRLN